MRGQLSGLLWVAMCVWFAAGCAGCAGEKATPPDPGEGQVIVELTGSPGARIHGFYVADGKRSEFTAALPLTLQVQDISVLAFAKQAAGDRVQAAARNHQGSITFQLIPGDDKAALLQLAGGFSGSYVPARAVDHLTVKDQFVIKPYWYGDTWVFDDPDVGLVKESFVRGVPEMINAVVKDIPNARQGFVLTCSDKPFPGYQKKLTWVREDDGGNIYRMENPAMEGWFCPALFQYFDHAPKTLYAKAEAARP